MPVFLRIFQSLSTGNRHGYTLVCNVFGLDFNEHAGFAKTDSNEYGITNGDNRA